MTVSIIIPLYNVEPYIIRCIESVLRQTYRQLEVILVDDCSPDRSMEMARKHIEASASSKDLKFIYIKHEKNRGQAAARNTGLNAATGDFVYFLDSDDEITEDCIETLTNEVHNHPEVEIVCGNCIEPYEGMQRVYHIDSYQFFDDNAQIRYRLFCPKQSMPIIACNKLINLQFIKKNDLFFSEGFVAEDILWTFRATLKNTYLAMCPYGTYVYHLNPKSTTADNSNTIRRTRSMAHNLKVIADSIDEPFGLFALYKYLLRWFNIYKHLPKDEYLPTSMKLCKALWYNGERSTAVITWLYFLLYKALYSVRIECRVISYIRKQYLYQDRLAQLLEVSNKN